MDKEVVEDFLKIPVWIYNSKDAKSYQEFIDYLKWYKGNSEEKFLAKKTLEYVLHKNGNNSTWMPEITPFFKEEIVNYLLENLH